MWGAALITTLCGVISARGAQEDVGSPLRVAQCRASCLYTFGRATAATYSCRGTDCITCWDKCQVLESNFVVWGAVCSLPALCASGCQLACQFHREGTAQSAPVQVTQGQQVVRRRGAEVTWPAPQHAQGPLVYVLMRQTQGGPWRQQLQTLALSASVPASGGLRVLVVDRRGLVTIYRPESRLSAADDVLRRISEEALLALRLPRPPAAKRINTQLFSEPSQNPLDMLKDVEKGWNLRQLSLIHQKVLVIAEIAWNAQPSVKAAPVYFVTWEVDGGGLRGNLFTDATSVTLSLWPDTVYHIQVELVRQDWKHGGQSECLEVDTHTGFPPAPPHPLAPLHTSHPLPLPPPHTPVLAGVSASLVTFVAVLVLFAWRLRRQRSSKLPADSAPEPSRIFKVYPPAVRLECGRLEPIPSVSGGTSPSPFSAS